MIKLGLSLIVALMFISPVYAATKQTEPFTFNYDKIPFGKSPDEVLKLVKGQDDLKVSRFNESNPYLRFVRDYRISSLFPEGMQVIDGESVALVSELIQNCYINYQRIKGLPIQQVDLYFVRDFKGKKYTLAMIVKHIYDLENKYDGEASYARLKSNIVSALNIAPVKEFKVEMKDSYSRDKSGLIGYWETTDRKVILCSAKEGMDRYIAYISKPEWDKYIKAWKQYKVEKDTKDSQENKRIQERGKQVF